MSKLTHTLPHQPWPKPSRNEEEYFHREEFRHRMETARHREAAAADEERQRLLELHRGHCPRCGAELEGIRLAEGTAAPVSQLSGRLARARDVRPPHASRDEGRLPHRHLPGSAPPVHDGGAPRRTRRRRRTTEVARAPSTHRPVLASSAPELLQALLDHPALLESLRQGHERGPGRIRHGEQLVRVGREERLPHLGSGLSDVGMLASTSRAPRPSWRSTINDSTLSIFTSGSSGNWASITSTRLAARGVVTVLPVQARLVVEAGHEQALHVLWVPRAHAHPAGVRVHEVAPAIRRLVEDPGTPDPAPRHHHPEGRRRVPER